MIRVCTNFISSSHLIKVVYVCTYITSYNLLPTCPDEMIEVLICGLTEQTWNCFQFLVSFYLWYLSYTIKWQHAYMNITYILTSIDINVFIFQLYVLILKNNWYKKRYITGIWWGLQWTKCWFFSQEFNVALTVRLFHNFLCFHVLQRLRKAPGIHRGRAIDLP